MTSQRPHYRTSRRGRRYPAGKGRARKPTRDEMIDAIINSGKLDLIYIAEDFLSDESDESIEERYNNLR